MYLKIPSTKLLIVSILCFLSLYSSASTITINPPLVNTRLFESNANQVYKSVNISNYNQEDNYVKFHAGEIRNNSNSDRIINEDINIRTYPNDPYQVTRYGFSYNATIVDTNGDGFARVFSANDDPFSSNYVPSVIVSDGFYTADNEILTGEIDFNKSSCFSVGCSSNFSGSWGLIDDAVISSEDELPLFKVDGSRGYVPADSPLNASLLFKLSAGDTLNFDLYLETLVEPIFNGPPTPVPVPAAVWLFFSGLCTLTFFSGRRINNKNGNIIL